MINGEQFIGNDGTEYKVSKVSTWTTGSGKKITTGLVSCSNPNTRHGWAGEMSDRNWNFIKTNEGRCFQ